MPYTETPIPGLVVFEPRVWEDSRGYFYESYNRHTFHEAGITTDFVQDNQSRSTFGVLRGMHYQVGEAAQAKLVRVLEGEVLDVAIDIREGSETYGQYFSIRLSEANKKQLYIPRGFAHGFLVLSETAEFAYKCDNYYNKAAEGGILFNDPGLQINWEIDPADIVISDKDAGHPNFGSHRRSGILVH